jgi:hypothetical protein
MQATGNIWLLLKGSIECFALFRLLGLGKLVFLYWLWGD